MTDPVDEFWMPAVGMYDEKQFKSATRGDVDLSKIDGDSDDKDGDDKDKAKKIYLQVWMSLPLLLKSHLAIKLKTYEHQAA